MERKPATFTKAEEGDCIKQKRRGRHFESCGRACGRTFHGGWVGCGLRHRIYNGHGWKNHELPSSEAREHGHWSVSEIKKAR